MQSTFFHAGLLRIRGDANAPVFCDRDWRPIHEQARFAQAQVLTGGAASREAGDRPRVWPANEVPAVVDAKWWQDNQHLFVWRGTKLRVSS